MQEIKVKHLGVVIILQNNNNKKSKYTSNIICWAQI